MFRFFRKKPPPIPPTEKQRKYAARIGVQVTDGMTRAQLSAVISEAHKRNPELVQKLEQVKHKIRERKFGKELLELEDKWNGFADDVRYMLAVYRRAGEAIVDVIEVNEASITDKGKLKLKVAAPKVVKDPHIGDYLEWDKDFDLPVDSLLYHEPLCPDFHDYGNDAYVKIVKKGRKLARNLAGKHSPHIPTIVKRLKTSARDKRKPGCLSRLLAVVLLVIFCIWAIKSCGDKSLDTRTSQENDKRGQQPSAQAD